MRLISLLAVLVAILFFWGLSERGWNAAVRARAEAHALSLENERLRDQLHETRCQFVEAKATADAYERLRSKLDGLSADLKAKP